MGCENHIYKFWGYEYAHIQMRISFPHEIYEMQA